MSDDRRNPSSPKDLESLLILTRRSNDLAKKLTGPARLLAYRVKGESLSFLVLLSANVRVSGIRPGGIYAVDLFGDQTFRFHICRSHLTREARQRLDRMAYGAPAVARLSEVYRRKE